MFLFKRKIILVVITIIFLSIIFSLLFPQRWLIEVLSPAICRDALYFKTTNKPIAALTIDDSPDRQTTERILDILAEYDIVATFFPIGDRVTKNRDIIELMVRNGHEIGNHLTKDEPSIKLQEKFEPDLLKAEQILTEFTNIKWLRPGGGWCDREMGAIARKYNYKIALGSVWSYDTHITSSRFATWFILANTKPGSIIVLHDFDKRGERTIETLQKVIPELQKKGYNFVTLSDLDNVD